GASGASQGDRKIADVQVVRTTSVSGTLASARFALQNPGSPGPDPSACSRETFGDCTISKCPTPDPNAPADPSPTAAVGLEAGTITITTDTDVFSATGQPITNQLNYSFDTTGNVSGGEQVQISASGGLVDAFTAQIQMPLAPLLMMPTVTAAQGEIEVRVPRTADFTLDLDARGTAQTLVLVVAPPPMVTNKAALTCQFDAAKGTATFPSGALTQLAAGTTLRLFAANQLRVPTPQGYVNVAAAFEMVTPDKMGYPKLVLE
ncbi:MAG TPA: hypothetical protein VEQ59_00665, partial [Polyangiaceae bacterium]|nr:hypothetical protein [Polyangiaceae bacterium]